MRNLTIDFNKAFKKVIIVYAVIFLAGLVFAFIPSFGVNLDINFKGGTKIAYSYSGELAEADVESAVKGVIDNSFTVSKVGFCKPFSYRLIIELSLLYIMAFSRFKS